MVLVNNSVLNFIHNYFNQKDDKNYYVLNLKAIKIKNMRNLV